MAITWKTTRYAIEVVVGGVWTILAPDFEDRKDAVDTMRRMLESREAVRGQIHVIDLWA